MAVKTWTGTTNSNWNVNTNWTSGGGATTFPTAVDDVIFTAGSPNLIINVVSACLSIDFTNYVNTITFTSTLTVSGNVTLVAGFTQAGASGIIINANSTLTSNSVIWSRTLTITNGIINLPSNFTWSGTLQIGTLITSVITLPGTGKFVPSGSLASFTIIAATADYSFLFNSSVTLKNVQLGDTSTNSNTITLTFNSITFTINGNLTWGYNIISGTANINYTGTGTIQTLGIAYPTNGLRLNLTINTSSPVVIGYFVYNTGTFTYTSGSISFTYTYTNPSIYITQSTTLNTNTLSITAGVSMGYTSILSSTTITLNSTFRCTQLTMAPNASYAVALAGSYGFIVDNYIANLGQIFQSGCTYIINKLYQNLGGLSTLYNTNSSTTGSPAYIILKPGASCIVGNQNFTDIDASGGRQINVFSGVLVNIPTYTRTQNIYRMTDLLTVGS